MEKEINRAREAQWEMAKKMIIFNLKEIFETKRMCADCGTDSDVIIEFILENAQRIQQEIDEMTDDDFTALQVKKLLEF